MGTITHEHVTLLPDNPTKDVSANVWNQPHAFNLGPSDVGLGNVNNTSDINKPVSTATAAAIAAAVSGGLGFVALQPIVAPATPLTGMIIYVDIVDNKLKSLASTGVITILALP